MGLALLVLEMLSDFLYGTWYSFKRWAKRGHAAADSRKPSSSRGR